MSDDAMCRNCLKFPGKPIEWSVNERWFKSFVCDNCRPMFTNALRPLVRISEPVDNTRARNYNGYVTRANIETGRMQAVGSTLKAPLLMGLRVIDGIPDLIGRVVQAKFTEDEVLDIAAFLVSRPHWARVLSAMLAQRIEIRPDEDRGQDATFRRKLKRAGKRALEEMRNTERKAG